MPVKFTRRANHMSETPADVLELAFETLDDFERCKEAGTSIRTQYNRL